MSDPQRQRRRGAQFRYKDIRILRDDGKGDRRHLPTRRNIMAHIDWLVGDARAGDSLFFHFSGALVVVSKFKAVCRACNWWPLCNLRGRRAPAVQG